MQEDKHEISKDKDCQDFLAGIKELTRELTQIRERAAIEYTPIVEEFCARKQASENEVAENGGKHHHIQCRPQSTRQQKTVQREP